MKGIYCIENVVTGDRYIGQSSNIKNRIASQKSNLKNPDINPRIVNKCLFRDVQKYGIENFLFYVIQEMPSSTRKDREIAEREWMIKLNTFVGEQGYNLRSDDESGMVAHDYTRTLRSLTLCGDDNPNYGNNWSDEQKKRMSDIAKERHRSGNFYGDEWRRKQSVRTKIFWSDNPEVKSQMAEKVRLKKEKYRFHQYNKSGELIHTWESMREITSEHPEFHVQAIYSVCDGNKKSYRGFVWKKELKI